MNKAKTYRIIRVAKELNVGIGTIAEFLNNNGFSVENKPNVKLDEKMYETLLNEYADEKLLKEKAAQVELVKNDHESIVIHEDEKEVKAKKKKEEQILIKSVITHAESAAEAEVKGPKVVGKIELEKQKEVKEKEQEKEQETVKEVPNLSVFFPTIKSKLSSSHLSDSNEQQISPLPSLDIKFIISGVILDEAQTKSPSFSLDSSSTIITTSPFFIDSIASGIVFNSFILM